MAAVNTMEAAYVLAYRDPLNLRETIPCKCDTCVAVEYLKIKDDIRIWTYSDYSPTYYALFDGDRFVRLLLVRNLPPEWDDPSKPDAKRVTDELNEAARDRWPA